MIFTNNFIVSTLNEIDNCEYCFIKLHKNNRLIQNSHFVIYEGEISRFSSIQSLSRVWLFATPWTAACQASLSISNSWSGLKLMCIKSVVTSTISSSVVPFSSCLQSFPALGSFLMSQFFASGGQSTGVSPSASVLPMNIQDWFTFRLTSLILMS